MKPDGPVGAPSCPAHGIPGKYGQKPHLYKGLDCKALSRIKALVANVCTAFIGGRRAFSEGAQKVDGRTDWLCVGGTKAGPAVPVAVSLGGAPNGHEAGIKIGLRMPAGKGLWWRKIVMECRDSGLTKRGGKFFGALAMTARKEGICEARQHWRGGFAVSADRNFSS